MFTIFTFALALLPLAKGQAASTSSLCSRIDNIISACWTNTDTLPTAPEDATCICAPAPGSTNNFATVFDNAVSECIEYYDTAAAPTLASAFSTVFHDYCAIHYAGGGATPAPTPPSAPSPTGSGMITQGGAASPAPTVCRALLDIVSSCWTNTNIALTADNIVSCICVPPTTVAAAVFASEFNSVASRCASIERADPTLSKVFGYFEDYCSVPVEMGSGTLPFTVISATNVAVPSITTPQTVPSPTNSPSQQSTFTPLPSGTSPTVVPKLFWLVVLPVVAILML